MPSTVWIQFVKMPELGKVKTRLAATLGDELALEAHKILSRQVNRQLAGFMEQERASEHSLWLGLGDAGRRVSLEQGCKLYSDLGLIYDRAFLQHGEELGERMQNAFIRALPRADKVFIVGSDFPVLDREYCLQAIAELDHADVVLGATEDGGYGLIGLGKTGRLSEHNNGGFDGFGLVDWGSEKVCAQTKTNLQSTGLEISVLPERFDIDTEEDWKRWQSSAWSS